MYTLKKSLGQHFLKDNSIVDRILAALSSEKPDRLLEVGPGGGALTEALLKLPEIDFKAVEIDSEKVNYLTAKFPAIHGKLIHADFLSINEPFDQPFTVIGNFPYNISTQILFKLLDWKDNVPVIIGMFQQEVAQRIAAAPGSKVYGVTSALFQAFYDAEYLFPVPPESFRPPPKVMSAVIRLRRRTSELEVRSERDYKVLVKTAFSQRRKTLRNSLKGQFRPEVLKDLIFDKRAEALSIYDFAELTFKMI